MHLVVVSDHPARPVGKLFLQNEVLLDQHTLSDGQRLDFRSGCDFSMQPNRLFVHRDSEFMPFRLGMKMNVVPKMDPLVISDQSAAPIRKTFEKKESLFNRDPLINGCSLNRMTGRFVQLELDWPVIHGDGEAMALRLTVVMVSHLRFCVGDEFLTHWTLSLPNW
jgi:hypothetical protein